MLFRVLERLVLLRAIVCCFGGRCGQVAVDEFDEAVEVFGCDLVCVSFCMSSGSVRGTYRLVLLIEVVDVSVEDFDEQLNGHRCIHACIGDSKGPL